MFQFQYLGPIRSETAANMFYKIFTTIQPQNRQLISKIPAGFYKDLKSFLWKREDRVGCWSDVVQAAVRFRWQHSLKNNN